MKNCFIAIALFYLFSHFDIAKGKNDFLSIIPHSYSYVSEGRDSLAKYSYFMQGFQAKVDPLVQNGNGFFFRANHKLLFVTARHLATLDSLSRNKFDLFIEKQSDGKEVLQLLLPGDGKISIESSHKVPDVYIHDFSSFENYSIKSVEKLIDWEQKGINQGDTAVIFTQYYNERLNAKAVKECMLLVKSTNKIFFRSTNSIDTCNYSLNIIGDAVGPGSSGAPIFIKRSSNWQFGGICSKGSNEARIMYAVRPEIIIRMLKQAAN